MFLEKTSALRIAFATIVWLTFAANAPAEPKAAQFSQLAVDTVKLKSGKTMRGAVVHAATDGSLTMAVSREWLTRTYPDDFKKLVSEEAATQQHAWEQLRDRLKQSLAAPGEQPLAFRFKMELERVEKLLAQPDTKETPQFIWVDIPKNAIAASSRPQEERQRVAIWAWSECLANVESRDADDLSRELKQKGVDASLLPPDMSERLPPRLQDDREWAARLAIASYAVGEPLDFQGTGDMLVEAKSSRDEKDIAPILAKLLTHQVGSLIDELLNEGRPVRGNAPDSDAWLKPAIREAEVKKAKAFRATRVDMDAIRNRTTVQSVFIAQIAKGDWETIWSTRATEDASQERSEIEARISEDPQVKSALEALKPLGLVDDAQLKQAIRFGAATMAAQQAVDSRFVAFRDSMLKRLDGPPLSWEERRDSKAESRNPNDEVIPKRERKRRR